MNINSNSSTMAAMATPSLSPAAERLTNTPTSAVIATVATSTTTATTTSLMATMTTTTVTATRTTTPTGSSGSSSVMALNSTPHTTAETTEDDSDSGSFDARRKKKARTTFTGRQIFELEKQFEIKKYLSSSERTEMAKLLNVTETQVRELSSLKIFKQTKGSEGKLKLGFKSIERNIVKE